MTHALPPHPDHTPQPDSHPQEQASPYLEHQDSPAHIISGSTCTRLVGVGLVAALAATSTVVWASPTLRRNLDNALEKAPLPKVVQRALGNHDTDSVTAAQAKAKAAQEVATQEQARRLMLLAEKSKAGSQANPLTQAGGKGDSKYPTSEYAPRGKGDHSGGGDGTSAKPKAKYCWDFTWQQDAQAYYAADPTDPNGLDGNPGPRDDDGIACRNLPDDPNRPASTAVWPYVLPTPSAPPREQILNPAQTYFGLFTEQSPFNFKELDQVASAVDHRPSSVTWFAGWDQSFRADVVQAAWRRDMLPVITWEPRPIVTPMGPGSNNAVNADYQLSDILQGDYDAYIRQWARELREVNLPVAIRFAHEMNGFWYPWSEQTNGNKPGEFVAAWRHVHDLFAEEGALNAIWLWTPNVTGFPQAQPLDQLYPGDDYVDWVGLSGYYRKVNPGYEASFTNTYGKTLTQLRAVAPGKKILLAEVGATETGGQKMNWVTSFFAGLPANPDVIGFTWFNRSVTAIPNGEKTPVTNDWRITSSPEVTALFRDKLTDPRYSSGSAGPGARWEWRPETPATTPSPSPTPTQTPTTTPSVQPPVTQTPLPSPSPSTSTTDTPGEGTPPASATSPLPEPVLPATPTTPAQPSSPTTPASPTAPLPASPTTAITTSSSPREQDLTPAAA